MQSKVQSEREREAGSWQLRRERTSDGRKIKEQKGAIDGRRAQETRGTGSKRVENKS